MSTADYKDETLKTTGGNPATVGVTQPHICSGCGLAVPPGLDACPNDGITFAKSPQELLSDRYEFMGLVGKGGMSVIYKARHRLMDSIVAIKLLQDKLNIDKSSFRRFQVEAQAASRLDHQSIIKVLDFGVLQNGFTYLVMDFVSGRSLSDVIKQDGPLPLSRALPMFIQICDALSHAHKESVLHRDLKPSNILVTLDADGTERIKVVDFGIAKVLSTDSEANKLTGTGEVFGSPLYMSPEQCMGQEVDGRSDIYSMGCMIYETLTGEAPFVGTNPLETIFKQLNEEPRPLTEHLCGQQAEMISRVVLRTLDKNRIRRYKTFDELAADLEQIEGGDTVKRRGAVVRMPTRPRMTKLIAIGGVVLCSIAILSGIATFFFAQNAPKPVAIKVFLPDRKGTIYPGSVVTDDECKLIAKQEDLKRLYIRGSRNLTTSSFLRFAGNSHLVELGIDGTSVDNHFMEHLSEFPALKKLTIGNTRITADSFSHFKDLPQLTEIWINELSLTDDSLERMPDLPGLKTLKLDSNPGLSDHAMAIALRKFPNLDLLTMRFCGITPKAIDYVAHTKHLDGLRLRVSGNVAISRTLTPPPGVKLTFDKYHNDGSTKEMQTPR